MAFPLGPSDGQIFINNLGTGYIYDSTRTAWLIKTQAVGVTGINGPVGQTGIQGITGLALGATGIQGVIGLQGVTGIYGQTGIQGITGLTQDMLRIDGGFANSVYLPVQHINGGGA